MKRYDSANTTFYLDPPYPYGRRSFTTYGGNIPEPRELRNFLRNREGNVLMSYPDTASNRRLFGSYPFRYKRLKVPRALAHFVGGPKMRSELLVMNYSNRNHFSQTAN
jgi:site-specific DNA-adenine methylase